MLTFDPGEHRYWFDNVEVASVTRILAPLNDFSGISPDVLREKAKLGSAVHTATEFDDSGDLAEESVHAMVRPYLDAWRKFRAETCATVLSSEQRVFHPLHRYAGTFDCVLEIDGLKYLTEKKATAAIPASAGPQTAAYQSALGDMSVTRRAVVQLKPDGTYRFRELTDPNDLAVFYAALTLHRFKEANK